jgi:hypothetical protein
MVPKDIPQFAVAIHQAKAMNADALAGISTGFPPSIRIKRNGFRVVDGNGDELNLKPADLAGGEYLDIVILAAKPGLNKVYYEAAYDPNQVEASAPDCFSLDGVTPDASIAKPVNPVCATCPKNAFGSGRNAAGQPTKGKACADSKILAMFRKGSVYSFKIPPASLKNFGLYVKNLTNRGVPLGNVITYVGFDEDADYSVLQFRVGAFIPESAKDALVAVAGSQEVADIVKPSGYTALPPPKTDAEVDAKEAPKQTTAEDTLGKPSNPAAEAVPTPRRGRPKASTTEQAASPATPAATSAAVMSDDEITKALGL